MSVKMDRGRFETLTAAYGADPRRWPLDERAAGEAFMAADPVTAERILFEARLVDAALDASQAPVPGFALRDRVLALADGAGLRPSRPRRWLPVSPLAWASGAGWAAACVAGVIVGVDLTSTLAADAQADAVLYQASLSAPDDTEILG